MHLVENMAYVGAKPWHGLGNPLEPNQPIEVWKRNAGMDWTIEESEVRIPLMSATHSGRCRPLIPEHAGRGGEAVWVLSR